MHITDCGTDGWKRFLMFTLFIRLTSPSTEDILLFDMLENCNEREQLLGAFRLQTTPMLLKGAHMVKNILKKRKRKKKYFKEIRKDTRE
jgi:hypothetical protein